MNISGNSSEHQRQPNPRLKLDAQSESSSSQDEDHLSESSDNDYELGSDDGGEGDPDSDSSEADGIQAPETEEDLKKLKVWELKELLRAFEMPVSGRKAELIQRILGRGKGTKDVKDWKKSKAKIFLSTLINDPKSRVHNMTDEEIYSSHIWFQNYTFTKFKGYLGTLQSVVEERKRVVAMNEREVRLEMVRFPRNELTTRGYPFWHTHLARTLLENDVRIIREALADEMTPKELWLSIDEYQEFLQTVFCHHVHQEKRRQREKPGWVVKRNKKARKMHEKEMNEKKEGWNSRQYAKDINDLCEKWENVITLSSDEEE